MNIFRWPFLLLVLIPSLVGASPDPRSAKKTQKLLAYIGTYTSAKSKGIYVYYFDPATGQMLPMGLAAEADNPAFLTVEPRARFLYAVSEIGEFRGRKSGAVNAFAIDHKTGKLRLLNQVSSRGTGPCHLSVDKEGKYVFVANYGSGSIAALPLLRDGWLAEAASFVQHHGGSVNPQRQESPHAHMIAPSPDNRFVLTADLGLDQLLVYRFDGSKGKLEANDPPYGALPPGSGPRHFAFSPDGRFAYAICEMGSSITAFSYDAKRGALQALQTISTLPADFKGESTCAEIAMHPSGKFLYGSNRGHDSIAVFTIDGANGRLTPVEYKPTGGKTPRNFAIDPSGSYLVAANQDSNNLVVFRIDKVNGRLTPTGHAYEIASPVCVTFVEAD